MTDEGAIKKYEHLKALIGGSVKTSNPISNDLIVSDAERHMAQLVKARPNIVFEKPEVKEDKSKGKK